MTTADLDDIGASVLKAAGARSAPQLVYGFPGFNLLSVNDEIVHGIPGRRRLAPGDVLKLDVTAELDGYIADAARTIVLPPAAPVARRLRDSARQAFDRARRTSPAPASSCRRSAGEWSAASRPTGSASSAR